MVNLVKQFPINLNGEFHLVWGGSVIIYRECGNFIHDGWWSGVITRITISSLTRWGLPVCAPGHSLKVGGQHSPRGTITIWAGN